MGPHYVTSGHIVYLLLQAELWECSLCTLQLLHHPLNCALALSCYTDTAALHCGHRNHTSSCIFTRSAVLSNL